MLLKTARRVIVAVVGSTILGLGFAMIILPGPAIVFIPWGLVILATEFVWAKLWLKRVKKQVRAMQKGATQFMKR